MDAAQVAIARSLYRAALRGFRQLRRPDSPTGGRLVLAPAVSGRAAPHPTRGAPCSGRRARTREDVPAQVERRDWGRSRRLRPLDHDERRRAVFRWATAVRRLPC